jgi:hypothetical protein
MRRVAIVLASLLLVVASAVRAHDDELQAELLDEVLRLSHAGISDDIILDQIAAWDFAFELSADDIIELRSLGVSEAVLEALIRTGAVEDDGYRSVRTHVYFGAGYYSPWYAYPYAWAGYCDPFPRLYATYYYPFAYSVHFGYYGWCGGTYYAHYDPRHWRHGLRYGGHPARRTPYNVATGRAARPATAVEVPRARALPTGARVRSRSASQATVRGALAARRAPEWRRPESGRAGAAVAAPVRRGSTPAARELATRQLRRHQGGGFQAPRPEVRTSRPALRSQAPASSGARPALPSGRSFSMPRAPSFSSRGAPASPMAAPPPAAVSARFRSARP